MTTITQHSERPAAPAPLSFVRHRDEGRATWFFNALVTADAWQHETAGAYSLTEHLATAASNPPMHVQIDEDEAFYVLEGEIEFEVDGQVVVGVPGSFAFVARGAKHTFRILSPTARYLVICSGKPADNLEDFFFAMGDPALDRTLPSPRPPDESRLTELCARTGIELG